MTDQKRSEILKAGELKLVREQKAWKEQLADIKLDIQHLNAEKKVILGQIKPKRTELEGLKRAISGLQDAQEGYNTEIEDLKKQITVIKGELDTLDSQKTALETEIKTRKAGIDQELDTYEQDARNKADKLLDTLNIGIEEAQKTLNDLVSRENQKTEELRQLDLTLTGAKSKHEAGLKELAKAEADYREKIGVLAKRHLFLSNQVEQAEASNKTLIKENIELVKRNEGMKTYETRAWKILNAKDDELQQREKVLAEREQFKPSPRSLLPPV